MNMFTELNKFLAKPELYAVGTHSVWTDEYVSAQMLEAHLNPQWDAATRRFEFIDRSVEWIARLMPPERFPRLLDLGCGPGLYAERFCKAGYEVVGVDFSERSIEYARRQAEGNNKIEYFCTDYLTLDYAEQFDIVTLIYCDYAVLSREDRRLLVDKVLAALKPGGRFVIDVFTQVMRKPEGRVWRHSEGGGFFSGEPHICLESVWQYEEDVELRQSIVLTRNEVKCYNVWDEFFTCEKLTKEIMSSGFGEFEIYGDIAGAAYADGGETICGVFVKNA